MNSRWNGTWAVAKTVTWSTTGQHRHMHVCAAHAGPRISPPVRMGLGPRGRGPAGHCAAGRVRRTTAAGHGPALTYEGIRGPPSAQAVSAAALSPPQRPPQKTAAPDVCVQAGPAACFLGRCCTQQCGVPQVNVTLRI